MARRIVRVTTGKSPRKELPAWTNEFVLLTELLSRQGVLEQVEQRLRLSRRHGYGGLDVFLFLLAAFIFSGQVGLRTFAGRIGEVAPRLAALGHRASWPTSASVSRALQSISMDQALEFVRWLLIEAIDFRALVHSPSVVTCDRQGEAWHIFDYDPTVTALRQRALPQGEDLPEAQRRSSGLAARGYAGRKRGEVQVSRTPLQHAGSALWLWQTLSPGNGKHVEELQEAAGRVVDFCSVNELELERTLIRFDGGVGGVNALLACQNRGVKYLTRLARYDLLQFAPVASHLSTACWQPVEDSGSGPKREATELGRFRLASKKHPERSIETRVVVSRYRVGAPTARGTGRVIDGWCYELFATDLPAGPWPAAETVTTYYGRIGQENRFSQEDRELNLDRVFSFHPAGQLVATSIGLFLWNLRVFFGANLVEGLTVPVECPRAQSTDAQDGEPGTTDEMASAKNQDLSGPQRAAAAEDHRRPDHSPGAQGTCATEATENENQISQWLSTLHWSSLLSQRPGWSWDSQRLVLRCPNQAPLRFHDFAGYSATAVLFRFRARRRGCRVCPQRDQCTQSTSPYFCKEISFSLPASQCPPIDRIKSLMAGLSKVNSTSRGPSAAPRTTPAPAHQWRPPTEHLAGPHRVAWSAFLPAAPRQSFVHACRAMTVHLAVSRPPPPAQRPAFLAQDPAERQHRRHSWTRRLQFNALESQARVRLRLDVPDSIKRLLDPKSGRTATTIQNRK